MRANAFGASATDFNLAGRSHFRPAALFAALCAALMLCMAVAAGSAKAEAWVPAQPNASFVANAGSPFLQAPSGVAVDQAGDIVYATNLWGDIAVPGPALKFDLEGTPGSPATFGKATDGIAVVQSSGTVYGLNDETIAVGPASPASIQAYTPAGATVGSPIPVTSTATGGRTVQIASDAAGNVYFPSLVSDVVQVFEPDGTPLPSINGSGPNALHNPSSVAIDNADNVYVADSGISEKQEVVVDATGGTFTLTFEGQTTAPIAFSASQVEVQSALEALSSIGVGNVSVIQGFSEFIVTFQGKLASADVPQMTADGSGLTGGASTVTVTTTTPGLPGRVMKFDATGAFKSVIASGDTTGLGVDPVKGTVFVVEGEGAATHLVAYSPAGAELDDFGLGDFTAGGGAPIYSQAAVDSGTGRVYVSDPWGVEVRMYDPLPAPSVTTKAATGVTKTAAKLNATVNAEGLEADCEFEYDDNPGFASPQSAPCVPNPVIGNSDTPVFANVSGLNLNTTYYFHVSAENEGGLSKGADAELKTLPEAPVATTGSASGVSQTKATLSGSLNAKGDSASCQFEYGASASYGSKAPCSVNPVTGAAETSVSASLSGLSASTTYHYRVVGANKGGEGKGLDATFTTSANTCETDSSLCPPPPSNGGGGGGSTPPPAPAPAPKPKPLKCKKGFKKKTVKGKKKCVKVKKHKKHRH